VSIHIVVRFDDDDDDDDGDGDGVIDFMNVNVDQLFNKVFKQTKTTQNPTQKQKQMSTQSTMKQMTNKRLHVICTVTFVDHGNVKQTERTIN
jgi:hypothetical protein